MPTPQPPRPYCVHSVPNITLDPASFAHRQRFTGLSPVTCVSTANTPPAPLCFETVLALTPYPPSPTTPPSPSPRVCSWKQFWSILFRKVPLFIRVLLSFLPISPLPEKPQHRFSYVLNSNPSWKSFCPERRHIHQGLLGTILLEASAEELYIQKRLPWRHHWVVGVHDYHYAAITSGWEWESEAQTMDSLSLGLGLFYTTASPA